MAVAFELSINGTAGADGRYLTWTPAPCELRVTDPDGEVQPIRVTLANTTAAAGGKLDFRAKATDPASDTLPLTLPVGGGPVPFLLAGRFGSPSTTDGDAPLVVQREGTGDVLATFPTMVRIRKNANELSPAERDRFVSAIARLNDQGRGPFQSFRDTHRQNGTREAHGNHGFLPWHRAYTLDLERELQRLDPSVALPYWRFDQPAPQLFTTDFIGAPRASGIAAFAPSNPLRLWSTDGQLGIVRTPLFDVASEPAHDDNNQGVLPESVVVGFTGAFGMLTGPFESDPHGSAHVSFTGFISSIPTAARDPLFFLLHCNVDRLWAKWQWFQRRFDVRDALTYTFRGSATSPGATRIGHNLLDTMWPWNNVTGGLRPPTAPRTPFPGSGAIAAPGGAPAVGAMIDFQGQQDGVDRLGFGYDDVPFEQAT